MTNIVIFIRPFITIVIIIILSISFNSYYLSKKINIIYSITSNVTKNNTTIDEQEYNVTTNTIIVDEQKYNLNFDYKTIWNR